jgi:hypothetical protein
LLKLLFRCKEFFIIRVRALEILKDIDERERLLEKLKQIVSELNQGDEKSLTITNSEESKVLYSMSKALNEFTDAIAKLIL